MQKKPRGLFIGIIVAAIAVVVAVSVAAILLNNSSLSNSDGETPNEQTSGTVTAEPNEVVKVESAADGYETYLLDASGNIYVAGGVNDEEGISSDFEKIDLETENKVKDIVITSLGLAILFENDDTYLLSNSISSDQEINTSLARGTAKRIMIDEEIKMITSETTSVSSIQFLTASGDLYELVYDATENDGKNVKKIMQNIKSVESNGYNVAIIDNDGNGYVYGYNVSKSGILGNSDSDYLGNSSDKGDYVSSPVKIGANLRELHVASRSLMWGLNIYAVNNNDELLIMGDAKNNNYFMGEINGQINELTKIYDGVDSVYPQMNRAFIKTKDNKLIKSETALYAGWETEITTDVDQVLSPVGYGDILIVKGDTLYTYGEDGNGEVVELKDGIKRVAISKDYNGGSIFVVAEDGRLYGAGNNNRGQLGITGTKKVETLAEINYQ